MKAEEYEKMALGSYERYMSQAVPPKDRPVYEGPLADTPMAFEHPVLDWDKYAYHKGCQTQAVDWDENINYERMRNYRLERTREQLKAYGIGPFYRLTSGIRGI
ncbi:MAG: hypothetical protein V1742_07045 [Pseudomonadota bacterium]